MIYMKVAHVDDNDCDIFSFSSLDRAVKYIYEEHISEFILSDIIFEEFPEGDYTYIES